MNSVPLVSIVCEQVQVLEQEVELSLDELCRCSGAEGPLVVDLVGHGLLDPAGTSPEQWRFAGDSLALTRRARRLIHDLGLNAAGAAVVIELLQRIERLQAGA